MNRHERNGKGLMGVAIISVLGLFFALHLILPEVRLWPALLVALPVATMIAAHIGRNRRHPAAGSSQLRG